APPPPEALAAPDAPGVMVFTEQSDDTATDDGKKKREVHRIVIRRDGDGEGEGKAPTVMFAPADGKDKMRRIEIRSHGGLSRDDVIATLKEQGVTGKRAEAIADKLEAKRRERLRTAMAPMPPMPPIPPMPVRAWTMDGKAFVMGKCGSKQNAPIVNRDESDGNKRSHVMMFACSDGPEAKAARLSALKKAREAFAEGERARSLSEDMRTKVAADLDKAIAEIEKSGN
ncbi:MAG TPA: peptidase M56, BlaR1, partial [Sphingopyxis sp.]|nr:peptidase M56, BlaR1 [Sphingopyxis sp.]